MQAPSFDIFCRVVDNFGDIGVCWRLARRLAHMPARHRVRLWVDDLDSFARIQPDVNPHALRQERCAVDIVHWTAAPPALAPHDVVIEAFACHPPKAFLERMAASNSMWINLEYLSAEDWVESCHALPSPQPNGLRKAFFFPGFTPATGGLLREDGLIQARDDWLARPAQRHELLRAVGVPGDFLARMTEGSKQVLLFAYPDAPAPALIQALDMLEASSLVLVPVGVCPGLRRGRHGNVLVHEFPFLDQSGFDRLLWSSDLNCVRGEDSLVRALWAGKPLLWHIYPQEDHAHLAKLHAFLERSPYPAMVKRSHEAWNRPDATLASDALAAALQTERFSEWTRASAQWCSSLAGLPDLASSLVEFCKLAGR